MILEERIENSLQKPVEIKVGNGSDGFVWLTLTTNSGVLCDVKLSNTSALHVVDMVIEAVNNIHKQGGFPILYERRAQEKPAG